MAVLKKPMANLLVAMIMASCLGHCTASNATVLRKSQPRLLAESKQLASFIDTGNNFKYGILSDETRSKIRNNIRDFCPSENSYSSSSMSKMAHDLFISLGIGPEFEDLITELINTGSIEDYGTLFSETSSWIFLFVLGVIAFIVTVFASTACCCSCSRKIYNTMSCGACCLDRPRKEISEVSDKKMIGGLVVVGLFGVLGFFIAMVFCFVFADEFYNGYDSFRCDLEQTNRGLFFGDKDLNSPREAGVKDWAGIEWIYNEMGGCKENWSPGNGTAAVEVNSNFSLFDSSIRSNATILDGAVTVLVDSLKSVQDRIDAVPGVDHACWACESGPAYDVVRQEFVDEVPIALTNIKAAVDVSFGPSSVDLKDTVEACEDIQVSIVDVSDAVSDFYNTLDDSWSKVTPAIKGIYALMILAGIMGLAILTCTIIFYVFLGLMKWNNFRGHEVLFQRAFACHFGALGFVGSIGVIVASLIFLIMATAGGICYVIETPLISNGGWDSVGLSSNVSDALNECLADGGGRDLVKGLSLQDEVDSLNENVENVTAEIIRALSDDDFNIITALDEIDNSFIRLSWVVMPTSVPSVAFPRAAMTGIQMEDRDVMCNLIPTAMWAQVACADATSSTTIFGTKDLNNALNPAATQSDWCMKSLEGEPIPGCNATGTVKYIEGTSTTVDADIVAEEDQLRQVDTNVAAQWLAAVESAIQKEKLFSSQTFTCNGAPCDASAYMPYVTDSDKAKSTFVAGTIEKSDAIKAASRAMINAQTDLTEGIVDIIDKYGKLWIATLVDGLSCGFLSFTINKVSFDVCSVVLPSVTVWPLGLLLYGLLGLIVMPISWKAFHHIRDLTHCGTKTASSVAGDEDKEAFD